MYLPAIDPEALAQFESSQTIGTPERRLLLAILERAILDYVGNDPEEVQASESWLFCKDSSISDQFTFPWICLYLDLDPVKTLKLIRQMPRRGKQRIAPWYFAREQIMGAGGVRLRAAS